LNKKRSKKTEAKYKARQRFAKVEPALEEQFATGRVLGMKISVTFSCFIYFIE
jgi:small subunit ribosomal protein S8e